MGVLPVVSAAAGSAPWSSSASASRSLPSKAAAASAEAPLRPGMFTLAPAASKHLRDLGSTGLRGSREGGAAVQRRLVDRRATVDQQARGCGRPGPGGVDERGPAEGVARLRRGATLEERVGERRTVAIGGLEQRLIDLPRVHVAGCCHLAGQVGTRPTLRVGREDGAGTRDRPYRHRTRGEPCRSVPAHRQRPRRPELPTVTLLPRLVAARQLWVEPAQASRRLTCVTSIAPLRK